MSATDISDDDKVNGVKIIYDKSGAKFETEAAVKKYTEKAFFALDNLDVPKKHKAILIEFGQQLMGRKV